MTNLREDNAVDIICEIDYSDISYTHILADQYKYTAIARLKPSEFGRWTRIKDIGHKYDSEQVHRPKEEKIGVLFEGVHEMDTDVFLPMRSIQPLLSAKIPQRGPSGNSPHCLFCTKPDHSNKIEWPIDSTYTIHRKCLQKFRRFIESLQKQHSSVTMSHVV